VAAGYVIRPPTGDELGRLVEIEVAAGRAFADHGMPEIAADEPGTMAELEERRAAGLAWVAADGDGPLAYLLAAEVDGCLHIEQVSVDPAHAGRRIGAALIDHVASVALAAGRRALTLTTFRDIPWNAPYYVRLGFADLPEAEWGPQLRALVARERRAIPGDHPRVAMIKPVGCLAPVMRPPPAG
jgi:GNAT superfamily N-acetyltransferase